MTLAREPKRCFLKNPASGRHLVLVHLGGLWEASGGHLGRPLGSIWGASGRHLGGALGGQGDHRRPRGVLEEKVTKTIVFFNKLARDPLFCFDETRATLTKYCKNQ